MATNTSASSTLGRNTLQPPGLTVLDWIALVLMIIGSINWGLVGVANFNLVAAIFGPMSVLSRIIYCLVGLAGLWGIVLAVRFGKGRSSIAT